MEFKASPATSLGAEVELQLLDRNSLDLVDGILPLLQRCPDTTYIKPEYLQFTVEVASKVCHHPHELEEHLLTQIRMLNHTAYDLGMKLAALGTHPFCSRLGHVTPSPRYARVEADTGYVGYTQITYAMHVHIGIGSGDEAIRLLRRMRPYLSVLLAIAANSPYWRGLDTGFASYRQRVLMEAHAFGTPPQLDSWEAFEALVRVSERAHIFESFSDMHWDLRPRPDYGTLELRVTDIQPTVHENVALAATVQALANYLRSEHWQDGPLLELPLWLELENHYRASHLGLDAVGVVDTYGNTRPMTDLALDLLERIRPYAQEADTDNYLDCIQTLVANGGNCRRQRAVFNQTHTLKPVVAHAVSRLEEELQDSAAPPSGHVQATSPLHRPGAQHRHWS
ncbi:hypothetical protein CAI21_17675 [Alkalilimnicola ehrlichii]|uniref:Putative glutamate--cysteine ligase 2 n=1 Tax=Alkalilimnicola ehrlichii TaxID=351052 RepID=A0A3E0WHG6_9GAMM|nr:YbdK family carboxylate-amine ligase [Alkalilimnicola ehrlichii]RFA26159.1 hypothetical protein CAI21_17675 [Alkalilimnicola ehrlichii]RFA32344.1 hypothetical protein CAL65_19865 [Alkalilimnicola ehrlichii]